MRIGKALNAIAHIGLGLVNIADEETKNGCITIIDVFSDYQREVQLNI